MQLGAHTACTTTVASCPAVPGLQLLVDQLAITAAKTWEKDRQLAELEDDLAAGDASHWQAGIA